MTTENDHLKKKREWKTQYEIGCVAEMSNSHLDIVQQTHAWVSFGDYSYFFCFYFVNMHVFLLLTIYWFAHFEQRFFSALDSHTNFPDGIMKCVVSSTYHVCFTLYLIVLLNYDPDLIFAALNLQRIYRFWSILAVAVHECRRRIKPKNTFMD